MSGLAAVVKRYVGEIASLSFERTGDMSVRVHVKDVRRGYGRYDFLVSPVNGTGEAWVSAERVFFDIDDGGGRIIP